MMINMVLDPVSRLPPVTWYLSLLYPILLNGVDKLTLFLWTLKKAFDTVDRGLLLISLKFLSIGDTLLFWLKSYIFNRKHLIKILNSNSLLVKVLFPEWLLIYFLFPKSINKLITRAKLLSFTDDRTFLWKLLLIVFAMYFNLNWTSFPSR